ncbi:MAG TPA: hypothetical protein VK592_10430 [Candidatus Dormibacteraeota bacterium]|nr:hypothetical protein [Candidatus Dormibacteraeota bacterium]
MDDLTTSWYAVADQLPAGWELDGLRCASSGLDSEERSDEWIAVAIGPNGDERRFRARDPVAALRGLADSLGPTQTRPDAPSV